MDVIELTRRLVETPSPNLPGDERAVAAVVREVAASLGLGMGSVFAEHEHRPNVVVDLDFGAGGRHLALSGHMDTKPIGDAQWATDPLTPTVIDGYMYGLGTCDMKGAVAAMLVAAGRLVADPPPRGRLSLVFTADEEHGSRFGSRFLAERGLVNADAIVIGEPGGIRTDWDQLNVVSRGIANVVIETRGQQGHSSLSQEKGYVSATQAMAKVLTQFAEFFHPRHPEHSLGIRPTVNSGVRVEGGIGYGVVPGRAEFQSDIRLVPGMDRDTFQEDVETFLATLHAADPSIEATMRFEEAPRDWLPPTEVTSDDPIVAACQDAVAATLGRPLPLGAFPGTTDACWLQGILGIPTLPAFGPGMLDRAHAADERVSVEALVDAVAIYERLTRVYCAGAS